MKILENTANLDITDGGRDPAPTVTTYLVLDDDDGYLTEFATRAEAEEYIRQQATR